MAKKGKCIFFGKRKTFLPFEEDNAYKNILFILSNLLSKQLDQTRIQNNNAIIYYHSSFERANY